MSQWEGNLAESEANKHDREAVVRLYRTWTSSLIFEARYRPQGKQNVLTLWEFAFESDKKIYSSGDVNHELELYAKVLRQCILDVIAERSQCDKPHKPHNAL